MGKAVIEGTTPPGTADTAPGAAPCAPGAIEGIAGGEPVTQAEVARFASLDPNMASQLVRGLEARGLLVRQPHPTDRRAYELVLTPEGVTLVHEGKAVIRPLAEAFFAPLGEERRELARMLRAIVSAQEWLATERSGTVRTER